MKIAVLGNVTLDFIAQDFRKQGDQVYLPSGFDAWRQEVLDKSSVLHAFDPEAVLLVIDGIAHEDDVARVQAEFPRAKIVVPHIRRLAEETPNFWDERMRKLAAMPFSLAGIRAIEDEFRFMLLKKDKKILAVDGDNTLWSGIISEDGADAVKPFADFQKGLLALRSRGVLLVLLSKNDQPGSKSDSPGSKNDSPGSKSDSPSQGAKCVIASEGDQIIAPIDCVFARNDMPLSLDDFSGVGVNWSPKAGNLLEICRDLNLGVDSVVFVDDNPHERAQMKAHLPEVSVVPFPDDMMNPSQFLRRLEEAFFSNAGMTEEDAIRSRSYCEERNRKTFEGGCETVADYLTGLKLRCSYSRASFEDIPRLAQMAGKTNQFNATTIRRGAEEFAKILADDSKRVWVFRARDAFGDMGLVCYVIYDSVSGRITDFVMSCRAMGRTLEHFALNAVRKELSAEGLSLCGIDYLPTLKNGPFKSFLESVELTKDLNSYYVDDSYPVDSSCSADALCHVDSSCSADALCPVDASCHVDVCLK